MQASCGPLSPSRLQGVGHRQPAAKLRPHPLRELHSPCCWWCTGSASVLDPLQHLLQGIEPEIRTYNTVIIACNMSGQAQEALKVYERMLAAGAQPTATTYTALISAYGKNGQLDKALQIFQDMVRHGPAGLQRTGEQHRRTAAHSVPAQIQVSPGRCTPRARLRFVTYNGPDLASVFALCRGASSCQRYVSNVL